MAFKDPFQSKPFYNSNLKQAAGDSRTGNEREGSHCWSGLVLLIQPKDSNTLASYGSWGQGTAATGMVTTVGFGSTYIVQAPEYHRNKAKSKAMVWLPPPASSSGKFNENQSNNSNLKAALSLGSNKNINNLTLLTPSLCDLCAASSQINILIKNRGSSHSPESQKL